ncbi:hypothetical protein [Portibacter lacus]|uniref:Uncharacterized protein n=1 Tax=Portibacter lacus TaxID=1099794 RepID=A0AA37SQX8_9BACT|nr:hypothetical protein [Portibacter lacus]GLR18295.1 hypothetical protein GCM10007940_29110 [Portibacter lacus]
MKKTLGIIFLFFFCLPLHSQTNEGTEFWLGSYVYDYVNDGRNIVIITSRYETSGIVEIPGLQKSFTGSIDLVTNYIDV